MSDNSWLQFLSAQGAIITDNDECKFAESSAEHNSCSLIPLTHYKLLVIEGPDAEKFLQGQVTCDLRLLSNNRALRGGHCTPKGRLIFTFFLVKTAENQFTLRVHSSVADTALASLKKYIVFSKADIKISESIALAIRGADCAVHLEEQADIPDKNLAFINSEYHTVIRHNSELFEYWIAPNKAEQFWSFFKGFSHFTSSNLWDIEHVKQGIAELRSEAIEAFLPEELNFEQTDAVSFNKGCYTGQEIIARMHFKGKAKKHMRYATAPISIGEISSASQCFNEQNRPVGKVAICTSDDQSYHLLIVINDDLYEEKAPVTIGENSPHNLQWHALPYAIT